MKTWKGYYITLTNTWTSYMYIYFSVDGGWSIWGSWGTCFVTCGDGMRTRTRTCDNPPPANRGDDCPGPKQKKQAPV